ncbi:MAG: hypothetical protein ACH37Z_15120 [Anaerolineae bacterium]
MAISLASDTIWQQMAEYIWAQVGVSLGLKSSEQGNYLHLPTGDALASILPLVLVEETQAPGRVLPGFDGVELVHRVRIHCIRMISDTEIRDRVTRTDRDAIAALYCQKPFEGPTSLPGVTMPTRANVWAKNVVGLHLLDTFTEMELNIGHGAIDLDVTVHYYH